MGGACFRGEMLPMATDDPIRASDVDREVVVSTLREAYTAGRLTLEEFDERTTAAYSSKTWGDLRMLTVDLPSQPILGSDVTGRQLAPAELPAHRARPQDQAELRSESDVPEPPVRRRRPIAILIPVAIWTLLVVHGSAAPKVFALAFTIFL